MTTFKVGYLIGSIATDSINRLLAKALVRLAPPDLDMVEVAFRDLPIYSYDHDADPRRRVRSRAHGRAWLPRTV